MLIHIGKTTVGRIWKHRINDSRMRRIPPHRRPQYTGMERMAILQLQAMRGWNKSENETGTGTILFGTRFASPHFHRSGTAFASLTCQHS
jgi:hypothetical protein